MSNKTRLEALMEPNNGYLLTADVVAAGVSKTYLSQFVEEHSPERVAHWIYLSKDAWVDDYYILYRTNRRIIFSHESALYLYNMVDREPSQIMVAVPAGYNATHLRRKGIRVFQMKPEMYELGSVRVRTSMGNVVAAYD
ncbi:MAG: type IV toxin-antitoxin system AbiEi family antitoxin domain-containing protein [Oscillospiraceae bacterium]|nr:type IV toxin-antitoxin system AbiEi family antitoxin domain-containing protein [Oscillospiraceae bacterium]